MKYTDDELREAMKGTGYTLYRIKSDVKGKRGLIVVPEEYDEKASELIKMISKVESLGQNDDVDKKLRAMAEDVIYMNMCMDLAEEDIEYNEGAKKQNAEKRYNFFRTILENIK